MCLHIWITRTVPGWPKCQEGGRRCCCPCPRPSSPTPAPGPAWQSPACFPPLANAPLPSVACLQHGVSWQTNQFCSKQSLSSYVYLIYHGRSADCVGLPIDCSNWVQLQLYSFVLPSPSFLLWLLINSMQHFLVLSDASEATLRHWGNIYKLYRLYIFLREGHHF